jgi:hypothetical protein
MPIPSSGSPRVSRRPRANAVPRTRARYPVITVKDAYPEEAITPTVEPTKSVIFSV